MARELYEAFVGSRNGNYYLAKFDDIEKRGGGFVATWNWPAFLFNSVWVIYRKQYGWFFAFWGIGTIASFAEKIGLLWLGVVVILASMVLFGLYANALYYKRAKRFRAEATAVIENPSKRIEYLHAKGGVHAWVPWVFTAILVVGVLTAVLLPLFQDQTVAKRSAFREHVTGGAPQKATKSTALAPKERETPAAPARCANIGIPSVQEFMEKARPLNPGVSDAALAEYWTNEYSRNWEAELRRCLDR